MTLNESIIKELLKEVKHPASGASILEHMGRVVVRDNQVFTSIYEDGAKHKNLEFVLKECEAVLLGSGLITKAHITITNRMDKIPTPQSPGKKSKVNGVNKIIVVASGKGGVGKSTIAFNLAISLANEGYNVGFVDADIYGPSLVTLSGIGKKPALEDNMMIPHRKFGIKMMSVGFLIDADEATVWRGPMTTKVLFQLIRMTKWAEKGPLDYLVIDTPPGTGDVHLSLAENYVIDGAVIISTPQKLAVSDARKGIDMYRKLGVPVIGVIENMSFIEDADGKRIYIFGKEGGKNLAKENGLELLGEIPLSTMICESTSIAKPFAYYNLRDEISKIFKRVVLKIVNKV